jgi:hypothetical protein
MAWSWLGKPQRLNAIFLSQRAASFWYHACHLFSIMFRLRGRKTLDRGEKKTDVVKHSEVFNHVGILVNGLLGTAEAPFI